MKNRNTRVFLTFMGALLITAVGFTAMRDKLGISHYFSKYKTSVPVAAPSLMLPTFQNETKILKLDQFKGQVVLVHFFASWCSHCRAEHPTILEVAKTPGLKILGVNVKDMPADLEKWLKETGNPYTAIGLDQQAKAAQDWKVEGTPQPFLINKQGKIIYQHSGELTASDVQEDLIPLIKKAIKW
jgi:cytochrome c biogenesis protein CcmG/thiol:disulfide interchange protein DsbE